MWKRHRGVHVAGRDDNIGANERFTEANEQNEKVRQVTSIE